MSAAAAINAHRNGNTAQVQVDSKMPEWVETSIYIGFTIYTVIFVLCLLLGWWERRNDKK